VKYSSLLGLVPLVLYLGAFTLVPAVSTLVLSFRTPEGHWGLGAFRTLVAHYVALAAASPIIRGGRRLPHLCPAPGARRTPSTYAVNLCVCRRS
jgi:ABC-type sugar transport system permease subunit